MQKWDVLALIWKVVTLLEVGCWPVCFWWMHRISSRQDALLIELREQAKRIEQLSKEEHEILKELHPTVQKIEKDLGEVAEQAVS